MNQGGDEISSGDIVGAAILASKQDDVAGLSFALNRLFIHRLPVSIGSDAIRQQMRADLKALWHKRDPISKEISDSQWSDSGVPVVEQAVFENCLRVWSAKDASSLRNLTEIISEGSNYLYVPYLRIAFRSVSVPLAEVYSRDDMCVHTNLLTECATISLFRNDVELGCELVFDLAERLGKDSHVCKYLEAKIEVRRGNISKALNLLIETCDMVPQSELYRRTFVSLLGSEKWKRGLQVTRLVSRGVLARAELLKLMPIQVYVDWPYY